MIDHEANNDDDSKNKKYIYKSRKVPTPYAFKCFHLYPNGHFKLVTQSYKRCIT